MKPLITQETIQAYIQSKEAAWSLTTRKSEAARLRANLAAIIQGPKALLSSSKLKPYSLKTLFIRAGELYEFAGVTPNIYKEYLRTNALTFKNAYERVPVELTWEEAKKRLQLVTNTAVQRVAFGILRSGMRANEALTYDGSGLILGKGSKPRSVFIQDDLSSEDISYTRLYRELKKVGLKPHDLRKLAATKLVDAGLKEADLMKVFGWSSIATAGYYLQSKKNDELKAIMKEVLQ